MRVRSEQLTHLLRFCGVGIGARGWVLFARELLLTLWTGLSMGDPITLAFLDPQLARLPVRANVAEVAGQWLGGGYWLSSLKH